MPKSAKKRKEKAADFSKAKLKLGKGKQTPSNVIDTSFKARSIALPNQSISREKDVETPTTRKNLTFDDLVAHTKHYNPGTRRDAISSMRELLDQHPELLESHLPPLINVIVRLIADEDASVRKSLHQFFSWLLPQIPKENIIPHAPVLLLFTTSAQTHIFPEIRLDAVRFLDILMDRIPETIVDGWNEGKTGHGARILEGYLGSLNAGTAFNDNHGTVQATSTASIILTPQSKLILLQSLASFLRQALSSHTFSAAAADNPFAAPFSSWYLIPSFVSQEAHTSFDKLLRPTHTQPSEPQSRCRCWKPEVDYDDHIDIPIPFYPLADALPLESSIQKLADSVSRTQGTGVVSHSHSPDETVALILHIARVLHGTLISTFLDFAPSVFSPNGKTPETDVKIVLAIANITRSLYAAIVQGNTLENSKNWETAREDLKTLINYMAAYFPFSSSGGRDIKVEDAMLEMNLIYCELASLLILTSKTSARSKQGNSNYDMSIQTERVNEYVIKLLRGEPVDGTQLGRALTPSAYLALLPTIWSFLSNGNTSPKHHVLSTSILQATLAHAIRVPSKSGIKKLTVEFVGRIVLLETERTYEGAFRLVRNADEVGALEEWLNHLPKVLWELGTTNLPGSEVVLRFLVRLTQRTSKILHDGTVSALRSRLVPFFCVEHPVRGRLLGPFSKLPAASGLQSLALDLVATIQQYNAAANDTTLDDAVALAVAGTRLQSYWTNIRRR